MNYSQSANFQKTADMAVRFLAGTEHCNVARLFQQKGFTCELETESGSFFESLVLDETDISAHMKIYWGISVNEQYRSKVEDFARRIGSYLGGDCTVGIDDSGRILSSTELSYKEEVIETDAFERAEKACYEAIRLFHTTMTRLNCCGSIGQDESAQISGKEPIDEKEDYEK